MFCNIHDVSYIENGVIDICSKLLTLVFSILLLIISYFTLEYIIRILLLFVCIIYLINMYS